SICRAPWCIRNKNLHKDLKIDTIQEFLTKKDSKFKSKILNHSNPLVQIAIYSEKYSPNTLWTKYSILRSTLIVYEKIDISQFNHLISFLKVKSKGYVLKKSKVLSGEQVLKFLKNAPDDIYLLH
ncbi:hypothetical protein D910_05800, partial [Dendroctonus ponderosae]